MSTWSLRSIILALFTLLLASCTGPSGWIQTDAPGFADLTKLQPPASDPDAAAITVIDEATMEIFGSGEVGFSVFDRHRVIKIFNPRGHRYANVMIPYGSSSLVSDITARTITPSGRSVELRKEDVFDVSLYPNFVFFSDQRAKIFTLPAIEDGSIIEYTYRLKLQNRGLWHAWYFQDDIPVLHSRFTLVKPSEWPLHFRNYGQAPEPKVTPGPAGFKSRHAWEAENIPPIVTEFGMPPYHEILSRVAIAPVGFEQWTDVSAWYYDILHPKSKGAQLVAGLADSLSARHQEPRERLRAIFEWVRDHVRYIAVEIGVGGYQPHEAEDVLERRYGDCKDMVVLVCALAARADIRVLPVMISTHQNGLPDTSLPSPLQFNHLIAYAPDFDSAGIWMDATEKNCRFGTLPWYDQGVPVVAATAKGETALLHTPLSPSHGNGLHMHWMASVDSTGATILRGTSTLTGAVANEARHALRSATRADRKEWFEDFLAGRVPVPDVDSLTMTGADPEQDTLQLSYTFRSAAFASRNHVSMIMRPGDIIGSTLSNYFRSASRTHPVRFRFGSCSSLELTVHPPAGWKPGIPDGADSIRSEFGTWSTSWETRKNTFHMITGYSLAGEDVSPERYPSFQRFLDSALVLGRRELVMVREN